MDIEETKIAALVKNVIRKHSLKSVLVVVRNTILSEIDSLDYPYTNEDDMELNIAEKELLNLINKIYV